MAVSTQVLLGVAVSVLSGAVLIVLQQLTRSRSAQGERLGKLESWIDQEKGRQQGRREMRDELRSSSSTVREGS